MGTMRRKVRPKRKKTKRLYNQSLIDYRLNHIEGGENWDINGVKISFNSESKTPISLCYGVVPIEKRKILDQKETKRQKFLRLTRNIMKEALPLMAPIYFGGRQPVRELGVPTSSIATGALASDTNQSSKNKVPSATTNKITTKSKNPTALRLATDVNNGSTTNKNKKGKISLQLPKKKIR